MGSQAAEYESGQAGRQLASQGLTAGDTVPPPPERIGLGLQSPGEPGNVAQEDHGKTLVTEIHGRRSS